MPKKIVRKAKAVSDRSRIVLATQPTRPVPEPKPNKILRKRTVKAVQQMAADRARMEGEGFPRARSLSTHQKQMNLSRQRELYNRVEKLIGRNRDFDTHIRGKGLYKNLPLLPQTTSLKPLPQLPVLPKPTIIPRPPGIVLKNANRGKMFKKVSGRMGALLTVGHLVAHGGGAIAGNDRPAEVFHQVEEVAHQADILQTAVRAGIRWGPRLARFATNPYVLGAVGVATLAGLVYYYASRKEKPPPKIQKQIDDLAEQGGVSMQDIHSFMLSENPHFHDPDRFGIPDKYWPEPL